MAWFNKTQDAPAPITIERVGAMFDRNEWSYEIRDGRLLTGFVGYFVTVRLVEDQFMVISVNYVDVPLSAEDFPKLQAWADGRNRDGSIGTVQIHLDEDNSLMVISDHTLVIRQGATDEQLSAWFDSCLDAQLQHMGLLAEEFGVKPDVTGES